MLSILPMTLLYSLVIHLFYLIIWLAAPFDPKAGLWITGRKGWRKRLQQYRNPGKPVYWFHAASLGEFEQGRPLIEEIKKQQPGCTVVLTFYSPSGYEVRKNYREADLICYLPLDTSYNAREFIRLIRPDAVFFIKYEYWFFFLKLLHENNIPVYLISAIFRQNQAFFSWYGYWFRNKLRFVKHFFLQDQPSARLLNAIGFRNHTVSGDTRFDRVRAITGSAVNIAIARAFTSGDFCLVAGSTWPRDEEILARLINETGPEIKMILAPHEIHQHHISRLASQIKKKCVLFSEAGGKTLSGYQVLIVDNIGMLSSLYQYGHVAYIGGGFGAGIHNILEPAANGLPVIFGPNYGKFREAADLIGAGGAFSINQYDELKSTILALRYDKQKHAECSRIASRYVTENTGATQKILKEVFAEKENFYPISL